MFKAGRQACGVNRTAVRHILIHEEYRLVGNQRLGKLVQPGQIRAQNQRGPCNGPQRELGPLLILRQPRLPWFAPPRMRPQPPFRQHVRVGPVARFRIREPLGQPVEFVAQAEGKLVVAGFAGEAPGVPVIVRDAPHLRIFSYLGRMFQLGRPRRKTQHDRPACLPNRQRNLANLGRPVRMVADAVYLDIVQPPSSILQQHGIVVGLPGRIVPHAVIAIVPGASLRSVARVSRVKARPRDGQILPDHLLRNSAHNMDAELQPLGMNPVGQRLEPRSIRRRGKAVRGRNLNSVAVKDIFPCLQLVGEGVLHVPPLVDHGVLPAVLA